METPTPLERAIEKMVTAAALAERLGVSRAVVNHWHTRGIPARFCPLIEVATGIPCEELKPDVPWGLLRNTPVSRALPQPQLGQDGSDGLHGALAATTPKRRHKSLTAVSSN